ncbi:hypothetical protein J1N35_031983 [Gossypium stocksii]|uniref:Uncharacterized protein n=1 Tax=Gossypium stocksii TaxID=47602 RepID=A0A9D3ZU90_9ROSI|nr:hypothetical protein J1N35_031983 [Gossypium stocksii]
MAQNAPHGGLSIRWGLFGPRELTQFKELLEKPVRLKPEWPNDKDMATYATFNIESIYSNTFRAFFSIAFCCCFDTIASAIQIGALEEF